MVKLIALVVMTAVQDAEAVVSQQIELFNEGNAKAMPTQTIEAPLQIAGRAGKAHRVLATAEEIEAAFSKTYARIRADNYSHSRVNYLKGHLLREGMVLVDYNFTRLRDDGSEMSTGAVFYVVKKFEKGWRIIAFFWHSIDERVELVPVK